MILASAVAALFVVTFLTHPSLSEGLQCYECSGSKSCGREESARLVTCTGMCMSYRSANDNEGTVARRCCTDDCDNGDGSNTYLCTHDRCNGAQSDRKLFGRKSMNRVGLRVAARSEQDGSSVSCYDCSAHNPDCGVSSATLVHGCQSCMVYRNTYDGNNVVRRCCTSGCGAPGTIAEFDGRKSYFCASNECNGAGAETMLPVGSIEGSTSAGTTTRSSSTTTSTAPMTTTTHKTSFSCYECSGLNEQSCKETALNCPMCMVHRNDNDPTKFDRRCCWWACGTPNQVSDYNGRPTYFCNADHCNGLGSEAVLGYVTTTTTGTTSTASTAVTTTRAMTATATEPSASQCFDCSGPDCGSEGSAMSMHCPKCMVYRNPDDQTKIERRCCWWGCGPSNTVSTYNGIETYFCTGSKCNGYGAEYALGPPVTTTTRRTTTVTTTTTLTTTPTTTTVVTTEPSASQCFDCSDPDCGSEGSAMSMHCPKCMVYRNPDDQTKIERRCCWWGCGPSNSISTYNGIETYFCTGQKCNGYGAESGLSPPVTTTRVSTTSIRTTITTTTTARTTSTATATTTTTARPTTTATTTEQSSSQCFDCSGPDCGKEGSTMSMNCPKCMVYRNPTDQTRIERRCCWWGCGPSNTVGTHNGVETYFCTGHKCNGYGAESALSPPAITTTATTVTVSATYPSLTMTTPSPAGCSLNCQNGGTPETEDGCFCYCLENTSGRECERVNCEQPDVDPEVCSWENRALCEESESFAFECLHLCGKC